MKFRQKQREYYGCRSWKAWRDANLSRLTEAGVPLVTLASERVWNYYLLHGTLDDGSRIGHVDNLRPEDARNQLRVLEETMPGVMQEAGLLLLDDLRRRVGETEEA